MINYDLSVLVTWPNSFDYPLFRRQIPSLRKYAGEIIVCFTPHGDYDLSSWLKQNLPGCKFITTQFEGEWRNEAANQLITHSGGEWILFLEQDFIIYDYDLFFQTMFEATERGVKVIGYMDGNAPNERFHPSFLMVDRVALNNSSLDFSPDETHDHFGKVSQELKKFPYITLQELDLIEGADWKHLKGVTDNYFQPHPYYDLNEFYKYNRLSMTVEPMSEYWQKEMERVDEFISKSQVR